MIRVVLPAHLRRLAGSGPEVAVELEPPVTVQRILDALERVHPELRGTLRDATTHQRRPMVRFFACGRDLSLEDPACPLPPPVAQGTEPLVVLGAIAGG